MKRLSLFFGSLILISLLIIPIHSQARMKKLGQSSFLFLDIAGGAQPAGMGEAFTVIGSDADALFYNPAGAGKMEEKFDVMVNVIDWISGISYNNIAIVFNGGSWGNFGLTLITADYGTIAGTRVASTEKGYEETGQIETNAYAVGLSYAREITDRFTIGGQAKFAYQNLGSSMVPTLDIYGDMIGTEIKENTVYGYAFDVGTIFYPGWKSFRVGVAVTNLAGEFQYEQERFELPLTFTLGIGMDILDLTGEHPDASFLVALDAVNPRAYTERIHLGAEYTYKMISVRTGYKFNYDESGLTMGVGFNLGGVKIDYAYEDFGRLNIVNRVSLGMAF